MTRFAAVALAAVAVTGCLRPGPAPELRPAAPAPSHAQEAAAWRRLSLLDDDGRVAASSRYRAWLERQANLAAQPRIEGLESAGLGPWTSRGPHNVGGRTRAVVIHPTQTQTMWAAAVSGGIWKTTDGGASWQPADDFMGNLAAVTLALDPGDPDVLYAGTGEGFYNADAIPGDGVFKSTDGGASWSQLATTAGWEYVNRVVVSPASSNVVLAAVRNLISGGLFRSTNGGTTWSQVYSGSGAYDLKIDPNDPAKMIANVTRFNFVTQTQESLVVRSQDSGQSWQSTSGLGPFPGDFYRMELAYAAADPGWVFATDPFNRAVWRSTDGGATFSKVSPDGVNLVGAYYNSLWVSPADSSVVVTGDVRLRRSLDGGATFTNISGVSVDAPHADHHCLVEHPDFDGVTNLTVFNCNDGGVYRTDDILTAGIGFGWVELNSGFQTTQFYDGDGHGYADIVVGGTQDNGTLSGTAPSLDHVRMFGGDGGYSEIDPTDERYCYGEVQYMRVHRSTDACQTAAYIDANLNDPNANFVAPLALDPNDSRRMYAGGGAVWRTDDVRLDPQPVWHEIRPYGGSFTEATAALAAAEGHPGHLWIAQNQGQVYKTLDALSAGPTWTTVDDNGTINPLPQRMPTRLLIDPDDPQKVYITFGGYTPDNLYRTTDGGSSWTDISGSGATGLPSAPIRGIARHPCRPDWLYVGTEVGVFASDDDGATWSTSNEGPADVSVDDVAFMSDSGVLLAATHGRGIWTAVAQSGSPDFDGDGLDDSCDGDDDQDRTADGSDCAPFDPSVARIPGEVSGLTVTVDGGTVIAWAIEPDAQRYDVIGGELSTLRAEGGVGSATCLEDDATGTSWNDTRPDPPSGDGFYYLARAENSCGSGGYGTGASGPRAPVAGCP